MNDGGHYHIETSPLNSRANQWTGFYYDRHFRNQTAKVS